MDYRKEFERAIEKMRKLVEELNSFMEENGMPVNREDNKVLESKITALESLGGHLKSDPSDLNVIFMVKSANHGIELMLQDLKYAGPFGATETLEEDEELQDILDMFGVEREKLSQGYMDENSDDYFSIEFDEDYMDEDDFYSRFDAKNQRISINPNKAPKKDTTEEFLRSIIDFPISDDNDDKEL